MKNIKLPPKELRDYIEFRDGKVFSLSNMPPELKFKFYIYKFKWDFHKVIFR